MVELTEIQYDDEDDNYGDEILHRRLDTIDGTQLKALHERTTTIYTRARACACAKRHLGSKKWRKIQI